jgi:hypothetical protein
MASMMILWAWIPLKLKLKSRHWSRSRDSIRKNKTSRVLIFSSRISLSPRRMLSTMPTIFRQALTTGLKNSRPMFKEARIKAINLNLRRSSQSRTPSSISTSEPKRPHRRRLKHRRRITQLPMVETSSTFSEEDLPLQASKTRARMLLISLMISTSPSKTPAILTIMQQVCKLSNNNNLNKEVVLTTCLTSVTPHQ